MPQIAYTVSATFLDVQTRDEFIRWLLEGHVSDVVRGGASSGTVISIAEPDSPIRIECRYLFPGREAYDRYVSEHAPALRAEGLAKFPPERGVALTRTVGEVIGPG
jgi:hypothetical protein